MGKYDNNSKESEIKNQLGTPVSSKFIHTNPNLDDKSSLLLDAVNIDWQGYRLGEELSYTGDVISYIESSYAYLLTELDKKATTSGATWDEISTHTIEYQISIYTTSNQTSINAPSWSGIGWNDIAYVSLPTNWGETLDSVPSGQYVHMSSAYKVTYLDGTICGYHGPCSIPIYLPSESGLNGNFKSTVFTRTNETPYKPKPGANYNTGLPTDVNVYSDSGWTTTISGKTWSDGIPAGKEIIWASTGIIKDEDPGSTVWTDPRQMTDTDTYDVEFSSYDTPGTPDTNPSYWVDPGTKHYRDHTSQNSHIYDGDFSEMIWRAEREIQNGSPVGDWVITRIKGENGEVGIQGPFKSTVFTRTTKDISLLNISEEVTPGSYNEYYHPVPPPSSYQGETIVWSDGTPSGEGALWSAWKTFDLGGNNSDWSYPQLMADTDTYDVEFSPSTSTPAVPSANNRHNSNSPYEGQIWFDPILDANNVDWSTMIWRAERTKEPGGEWGTWVITKIKGENGTQGKPADYFEQRWTTTTNTTSPNVPDSNTIINYDGNTIWKLTPQYEASKITWLTSRRVNYSIDSNVISYNYAADSSWSNPMRMNGVDGVANPIQPVLKYYWHTSNDYANYPAYYPMDPNPSHEDIDLTWTESPNNPHDSYQYLWMIQGQRKDGIMIKWDTDGDTSTPEAYWSNAVCLSGADGLPGADGDDIEFIYHIYDSAHQFSSDNPTNWYVDNNQPAEEYTGSGNNNEYSYMNDYLGPDGSGWTDQPVGVTSTHKYEYATYRRTHKINGQAYWGPFNTPFAWSIYGENGLDGDGVEYIYYVNSDQITPTPPQFDLDPASFQRAEAYSSPWFDDPQPIDDNTNRYQYVSTRKYKKIDDNNKLTISNSFTDSYTMGSYTVHVGDKIWFPYSKPELWNWWVDNGTAGDKYAMIYTRYLYSYDGEHFPTSPNTSMSNWTNHPGGPQGDNKYLWMSGKNVPYNSEFPYLNTSGIWSDPICLTGDKGENGADGNDGVDGTDIEFIYYRTDDGNNTPSVPDHSGDNNYQTDDWPFIEGSYHLIENNTIKALDDRNYNTWTDNPVGITYQYKYEYCAIRRKNDEQWGEFCPVFLWSKWGEDGLDGDGVEYIYYVNSTNSYINPPAFDLDPNSFQRSEVYDSNNWHDDPQNLNSTTQSYQFVSSRKFRTITNDNKSYISSSFTGNSYTDGTYTVNVGDKIWFPYSDPTLWNWWVEDGKAGDNAPQIAMIYYRTDLYTTPYPPEDNQQVNIGNAGITNELNNGWSTNPGNSSAGAEYLWMSSAHYSSFEDDGISGNGSKRVYTITDENWTNPVCLTGEPGKEGKDGGYIEFIYLRTSDDNTKPNLNIPNDYLDEESPYQQNDWPFITGSYYTTSNNIKFINGAYIGVNPTNFANNTSYENIYNVWTDNPLGVTMSYDYEYATCRRKVDGTWEAFSPVFLWSKYGEKGIDGDGVEYIYYCPLSNNYPIEWGNEPNSSNTLDPRTWINNPNATDGNGRTFDQDEYIGPSGCGWTDDPQDVSKTNKFQYVSVRRQNDGVWQSFSKPTLWAKYADDAQNINLTLESDNDSMAVSIDDQDVVTAPVSSEATFVLYHNTSIVPTSYYNMNIVETNGNYNIGFDNINNYAYVKAIVNNTTYNIAKLQLDNNSYKLSIDMPQGFDMTEIENELRVRTNAYIFDASFDETENIPVGTERTFVNKVNGLHLNIDDIYQIQIDRSVVKRDPHNDLDNINIALKSLTSDSRITSYSEAAQNKLYLYYRYDEHFDYVSNFTSYQLANNTNNEHTFELYYDPTWKEEISALSGRAVKLDTEILSEVKDGTDGNPGVDSKSQEYIYLLTNDIDLFNNSEINHYYRPQEWNANTVIGFNADDYPFIIASGLYDINGISYVTYIRHRSAIPISATYMEYNSQIDAYANVWTDNPQSISENYKYEFISTRSYDTSSQQWGAFSEPVAWANWGHVGEDGDGVEYIYYRNNSETFDGQDPSNWTGDTDFQTSEYRRTNTLWSDNPTGVTPSAKYEWVSIRKYKEVTNDDTELINNGLTVGSKAWHPYSYPALWAKYGETGPAGQDGQNGSSGLVIDFDNPSMQVAVNSNGLIKDNQTINTYIRLYSGSTKIDTGDIRVELDNSATAPFNYTYIEQNSYGYDIIIDKDAEEWKYIWTIGDLDLDDSGTISQGDHYNNGNFILNSQMQLPFRIIYNDERYTKNANIVPIQYGQDGANAETFELHCAYSVLHYNPMLDDPTFDQNNIEYKVKYSTNGNVELWSYNTFTSHNLSISYVFSYKNAVLDIDNNHRTLYSPEYQYTGHIDINNSGANISNISYIQVYLKHNNSHIWDEDVLEAVWDGINGTDGNGIEYIYYCPSGTTEINWTAYTNGSSNDNGNINPAYWAPNNSSDYRPDALMNTWTDHPTGVDSTHIWEYVSQREYDGETGTWGRYTDPQAWSHYGVDGKDGDGIEYIYKVFDNSELTIAQINGALVSAVLYYRSFFETAETTPGTWNDNPVTILNPGQYQFCSIRKFKLFTESDYEQFSSIIHNAKSYGTEGHTTDEMTILGTLSGIKSAITMLAYGGGTIDDIVEGIISKFESLKGKKIWFPYSTPSIWSSNIPGNDGDDAPRIVMLYKRTGSNATQSWGNLPEISMDENITTVGNNGWLESPGNNTSGTTNDDYLWMTSNYYTLREVIGDRPGQIKYTVTSTWSSPVCLTGERGKDGEDASETEFIYLRTNSELRPNVPTGSQNVDDWPFTSNLQTSNGIKFINGTYIPGCTTNYSTGVSYEIAYNVWTDNPLGITSTYIYEYSALRKKIEVDGSMVWQEFSDPFMWSKWGEDGVDGDGIEYIYYLCNSGNQRFSGNSLPSNWTSNSQYNINDFPFNTGGPASGTPPKYNGWTDDPSGVSASNQYEYVSVRTGREGNWGTFTAPKLWARYGKDGEASAVTIDNNNENIAVIINEHNVMSSDNSVIEYSKIYMYDNLQKVNFSLINVPSGFTSSALRPGANSYYWDSSDKSYTVGFKFDPGQEIRHGRLSYTFTGNYQKDSHTAISRQTTIKVIGIHESDVPTLYQLRPTANVVKWTSSSYIPNTIYTYISYIENGENQIMKYYDSSKFGNNQLSLYVNSNRIDNIFANNDSLQILTSNYLINNSSIYVELKYNDILLDSENIPCIQDGLQGPKGDNSYVLDWTNDQINLAVDSEGYIKPRQVKYTTLNLNSLNGVFGNNPQFYAYWGETLNSSFVTPANETIRNLFSIPNNSSYSGIYKHTLTSSASSAATGTKIKFKNASNTNTGAVQCTAYIAVDGKFNKSNAKIPENGIDVPMIIQVWGNNKETTQTKILRVCGQHIGEDGIDGIDGQNAVTYEINPSVNSIKKSGSNYNPSSLSYTLIKYDGESVSQVSSWPTSLTTKWKWIKDDNGEQYDNNSILSPIPSTSYINLELLSGSTVIDRETIPIVSDGNTGQNATQYEIIPSSSAIIKTSSTVFDPMSISLKVIKHNGNTISSFTPSSSNGLIDSSKAVSYTCAGNNTKYLYKGPISLNNCISGTPATGSLTCYVHNNSTTGGTVISSTTIPIIPEGPQGFTGPIVRMRGEWDGWAKYTSSGTSGTGTNAYTYNEGDYVVDFTSTFPSSCNTPQKKYNYAQEHSANRLSQKYCSGKTHTTNSPIYDGTDPIYLDIVYYNNKYWVPNPDTDLKWFNTTVTEIGTNNVGGAHGTSYLNGWASPGTGNYWIEATQFDFVATKLLYADQALINQLTTHELIATKSNGYPVAGITSGSKAQGQNGTLMSSLDPSNNSTITSQVYASENISAGVNDPSNVRIFAGEIYDSGENSYSLTYAPFNVRQDGTAYMSKANIVGDVNIGENVNIGGNVNIYGEHVNISGDITANTLTLSSENTFFYNRQVNLPYFNIGENKVIYAMFYLNNSNSTALAIKPYNDTYLWMASENGLTHTDNPGEAIKVDDKKLYTLYSGYGQNPVRSGNPNEKFWIVTKSDLFIKKNESAPIITDTTVYEDLDSTELSHIIISEIQFYYNGYSVNPNGGNPVWNNQIAMVRLSGFNSTNISSSVTRTYGTSPNQTTLTFYKTGNIYVSINVPNTICEKSQVSPSSTVYDVTQFGHKTQYSGDNTIQLPFDTHNYTTNNQIWFGVGDMDEGALNYEIWVDSQHGDEVAENYFKNAISINSISIEYKRT